MTLPLTLVPICLQMSGLLLKSQRTEEVLVHFGLVDGAKGPYTFVVIGKRGIVLLGFDGGDVHVDEDLVGWSTGSASLVSCVIWIDG